MKAFFILCLLTIPVLSFSQTLTLEMSNPAPRAGEYFTLSVSTDSLPKAIFGSISRKDFSIYSFGVKDSQQQYFCTEMKATSTGKKTLGPFSINLNGKKYTTNKLNFMVDDSLPEIPEGLWIRKAIVDDTTFYIVIEQRIPALRYNTRKDNEITTNVKEGIDAVATELKDDSISNVSGAGSSSSSYNSLHFDGKPEFMYHSHIYKLIITDKSKRIILTKDDFKGLPNYYKFKDIVIN